jgi:hypothetical protein
MEILECESGSNIRESVCTHDGETGGSNFGAGAQKSQPVKHLVKQISKGNRGI